MTAQNAPPAPQSGESGSGSVLRQWNLVGVITLIVILSYVDRGAISLIVNPIKEDLGVSDVQMSYLLGFAFVSLYSLCSIPAGYLADIMNRKLLLFGAVIVWSVMMTVSGMAGSYGQLFAGRIGLGVGEAVLPPAAYSLIRDGVAPEKHARAFAFYAVGGSWGLGLGAFLAGRLFTAGNEGTFAGVPILGDLKPWQLVLTVPGLVGIALAFLVLTITEPPRRVTPGASEKKLTFAEAFRYVGQNWRLYGPLMVGATIYLLANGGLQSWTPTAISRKWGISIAEIAYTWGMIQLILLPINNWGIGYLMDRFARGNRIHMHLLVPVGPIFLSIIPGLLIFNVADVESTWVMLGLYTLCNCSTLTIAGAILSAITPNRLMGKITALYFLIANLLGFSLGPLVFTMVSDRFFTGPAAIADSISICYPIAIAISVVVMLYGAKQLATARTATSSTP